LTLAITSGGLPILPLSYKGAFAAAATTDFNCDESKENIWLFQFYGAGTIDIRDGAANSFLPVPQAVLTSGICIVSWNATTSKWFCYVVSDTGAGATNSQGGTLNDSNTLRIITTTNTAGLCYCINAR